ncbi:glycosyltransferase, partial [candidate division KSB3 bacterium]|nr:glycosyltransferase [candidate division KSB3 bacterium]
MRVALFQPNLSHYRIPVFDLLGMQPGIELRVYAGRMNKTIPGNKGGAGFEYLPTAIRQIRIKGHRLLFMQKQVDVINQKTADVVILPWDIHYLSLLPALALARRRGGRILLWGQGYSKQNNVFANGVRELLGRWSDGVILYTRTVAQRLINESGFPPEKVFVAQNALDQTPIQAARRKVLADRQALNTFRENLGLNPERTVLFVARLKPENKIDMLFEGLQLLRREQPDARLVIVGDGPERHRLQTLANRMGEGDAIIFAGAIYEEEKLAPYMLSAAVFAFPKYIGLSLMHAFGYGLPVIT